MDSHVGGRWRLHMLTALPRTGQSALKNSPKKRKHVFRRKTHLQVLMAALALENKPRKDPAALQPAAWPHCESCGAHRRAARTPGIQGGSRLSADALRPWTSPRARPETPVTRCRRRLTAQHGGSGLHQRAANSVKTKVTPSCPTLCDPVDYTVRWILQARILRWELLSLPEDLPNPGVRQGCPALQADSFTR